MTVKLKYSQEERLLGGLAHASIVTGAIGPAVGLLIYLTQKEKSTYVARQSLQAVLYQLVGLVVMIVVWSCWGFFYTLTFIPVITNADQYRDAPPPIFWVGMGSMVIPFIIMGLWGLYGIYGAIRVWTGADFRYVFIGRLKVLD